MFLLTDDQPTLLPGDDAPGLAVERSGRRRSRCSTTCAPTRAWSGCRRRCGCRSSGSSRPRSSTYDLAVDVTGAGKPSPLAAGLEGPNGVAIAAGDTPDTFPTGAAVAGLVGLGVVAALVVAGAVVVAGRRQ